MNTPAGDANLYDDSFFDTITPAAQAAARVLMPVLLQHVRPRTVVDVGCGRGAWVSVLGEIAGCEITGVDGAHVDVAQLVIPRDRFIAHDLTLPLPDLGQFDLALCMEVAEHLPPDRANSFVADLCRLAPTVMFSAAIPGQGGTFHINERWQSYWVGLFANHGYGVADLLRPALWENAGVPFCYRQNLLLFSRSPELQGHAATGMPIDVVHPELLRQVVAERDAPPTVGECLRGFFPAMRRSIVYRLGCQRPT